MPLRTTLWSSTITTWIVIAFYFVYCHNVRGAPHAVFVAVHFHLSYFVFALYESKNEIQRKVEYHVAAGLAAFGRVAAYVVPQIKVLKGRMPSKPPARQMIVSFLVIIA